MTVKETNHNLSLLSLGDSRLRGNDSHELPHVLCSYASKTLKDKLAVINIIK